MHIDSHEALGVLNTLFEILAPSSLRPVDMLLRSMFVTPDTLVSTRLLLAFWVSPACCTWRHLRGWGWGICLLHRFPGGTEALVGATL